MSTPWSWPLLAGLTLCTGILTLPAASARPSVVYARPASDGAGAPSPAAVHQYLVTILDPVEICARDYAVVADSVQNVIMRSDMIGIGGALTAAQADCALAQAAVGRSAPPASLRAYAPIPPFYAQTLRTLRDAHTSIAALFAILDHPPSTSYRDVAAALQAQIGADDIAQEVAADHAQATRIAAHFKTTADIATPIQYAHGWYALTYPLSSDSGLTGLACPTATTCTVVGQVGQDTGAVALTRDGGRIWTIPGGDLDFADTLHVYKRVRCPSVLVCYAVGGLTMARTTDGGRTWHALGASPGYDNDVACPSVTTCYAVGAPAMGSGTGPAPINATVDGGKTWHTQRSGTTTTLNGVACPRLRVCYAVGERGTILATTTGGTSWHVQHSGTLNGLAAITCPTSTTCYAVGGLEASTILATTDGGPGGPGRAAAHLIA